MSFWGELRRRNVFKVGAAYAVLAWLVIQIANNFFPPLGLPEWTQTLVAVLIVLGFPFALLLAWVYEITPEGVKKTDQVPKEASVRHVTGHRLNYVVTGLLVLAVGFLVVDNHVGNRGADGNETASAVVGEASPIEASSPQPSVAVLPFVNNSPDLDQDYFADGLSEQLRDSLNRIQGLKVAGSTSSVSFKGKAESLRTVGEALNVENVLEGSVRKSGDQLRVSARLTNVQTGYQLWSQTYERTLADIFVLQDEIARSVAQALAITLGVGELGRAPGMTRNVAAFDEFLKGEAFFFEFGPESLQTAVEHFQRAVDLDPTFSLAWATLGRTYILGSGFALAPADEWRAKGMLAADRARELTPDALFVLERSAMSNLERGGYREAAVYFEEQLPTLATEYDAGALFARGSFLKQVGRANDAIRYLERARSAEPLWGAISLFLGDTYAYVGAFTPALAELDRGLQYDEFRLLIRGYALVTALAAGNRDEIDRRVASLSAGVDETEDIHIAMARFLDDPAEAPAEIRDLAAAASAEQASFVLLVLAHWAGYYGDPETALALLRQARPAQPEVFAQNLWRPVFSDMRKLPEFKELVREMGLVDYWRKYAWSDFCRPIGDNDFACE